VVEVALLPLEPLLLVREELLQWEQCPDSATRLEVLGLRLLGLLVVLVSLALWQRVL